PGFLSDALGLALLLPPVRAVLRPWLARTLAARAVVRRSGPTGSRRPPGRPDVLDV
ncbi:MAG: FxsA family protein, partial [Acidimicrobiia bacterium]|nr:FxsA family protein [Acidimicrobiia bacterium]